MLGDWRAAAGEVGFWPVWTSGPPDSGMEIPDRKAGTEEIRVSYHTRSMGTARPGSSALAGQHLPQVARRRSSSALAKRPGRLRLVSVEAFAEMWLTPRLPSFRNAHPEIAIEFETSLGDHHEVNPARLRRLDRLRRRGPAQPAERSAVRGNAGPGVQPGLARIARAARAPSQSARMAAALRPGLGRLLGALVRQQGGGHA